MGYQAATQVKGLNPEINGKIVQTILWEPRSILIKLFERLMRTFYMKLKKEKGTKIAVVATARKLLRVIYCMF